MGLAESIDEVFDDEFELDLSKASEELDFSIPVKPGTYKAKVDEAKKDVVANGKNKGKPKIVLRFKILPDQEFAGRTLFKHCPLTGEGAGITRDVLKALGIDLDAGVKLTLAPLIDRECELVVEVQKDDPEGRTQIKRCKPLASTKATDTAAPAAGRRRSSLS